MERLEIDETLMNFDYFLLPWITCILGIKLVGLLLWMRRALFLLVTRSIGVVFTALAYRIHAFDVLRLFVTWLLHTKQLWAYCTGMGRAQNFCFSFKVSTSYI